MKTCGIYAIIVQDYQYMYIGQSCDVNKRMLDHLSLLKRGIHYNKKMQNVFNKYGEDSFDFVVIETCDYNKLNEREQYYIFEFGTFCEDNPSFGLNLTTGGDGRKQIVQSQEERLKRKESREQFIAKNPEFCKVVIGNKLKEKYKDAKLRKRNSDNMKKLHQNQQYHDHYLEIRRSKAWKEKMRKAHQGRAQKEETKEKISKSLGRKVLCENGMVFDSAKKAAQFIQETFGKTINVQAVCSGKRKTAAGFHFQWLDDTVTSAAG